MIHNIDTNELPHEEFVKKFNNNEMIIMVDVNRANYLFGSILSEYARKQALLRAIMFGGIILGFAAIFFIGWWSLIIFAVSIWATKKSRAHTTDVVIAKSLKDPNAYEEFAKHGMIAWDKE